MTEQEINIVIAEVRGWRVHPKDRFIVIPPNSPNSVQPLSTIPNHLKDLNAMREAERYLDDDQWLEYMLNLQDVLQRDPNRGKWVVCQDNMHATASQKAKAFVITIGKYKE
jgi:hypothetical protein